MKKTLLLILLFLVTLLILCFSSGNLSAQKVNLDSLKRAKVVRDSLRRDKITQDSIIQDSIAYYTHVREVAKWDGSKQRLTSEQTKRFITAKNISTSDFFKPKKKFVSDTAFLNDSVYVKAFRLGAYQRALDDNSKILKCYWGSFDTGTSSNEGTCFNINGNAELPRRQLIAFDAQLEPKSSLLGYGTDVASVGVLYGHIFKDNYALYTISGGIGMVWVDTSSEGMYTSNFSSQNGVCVPIVIRAYLVMGQFFGLGLGAYVNINSIQTTAGVNVSFAFGRLTTHERDANYKPRQRPHLFGSL
jgi:hypothetical protein